MATPNQTAKPLPSDTINTTTQDASSVVGSKISNIMENLGTLSLEADHTTLSKSEVVNCTRNMVEKISTSLIKLDTLAGKLQNNKRYLDSQPIKLITRLYGDVECYRETLEYFITKIDQIKGCSDNTYLFLQKMLLSIEIPEINMKLQNPFHNLLTQFIESFLEEKIERIKKFLKTALAETGGRENMTIVLEKTFRQVRDSVKSSKSNYPGKNELEIVEEMSRHPLCSGLAQPLATSLNCTKYLAWGIILELFSKPPPKFLS